MKKYYPEHYAPDHIRPTSALYVDALKSLAISAPSVKLPQFPLFMKITGGFRSKEFSILCGATGTGKTTLLANISADLVRQGVSHFVASVETGANDFMIRVASCLMGKDLNQGDAVPVETLQALDAGYGTELNNDSLHLSLYDNRYPIESLMADLHYARDHYGCQVAMLDNLNFFMEVTRAQDSIVEMDRVIHELIIFCKQVDMHVILVMHPKKTDHGRVESEFEIKGSSTAVQEAHNVFLFNRVKKEDLEQYGLSNMSRELKLQKMRRRGKYIGSAVFLNSTDGVSYQESKLYVRA